MPKKTLDDWRNTWDDFSGPRAIKVNFLLQQYVDDSQTGVAGVLHPMTWFAASKGENAQYLSVEPIKQALKHVRDIKKPVDFVEPGDPLREFLDQVVFNQSIESLLRDVKQHVITFYSVKFPDIADMCEGDELLHVLQVIEEKTGVDYFSIELMQDAEEHQKASHV